MKKVIALLALVLSSVAIADSALIFETQNYSNYDVASEFQINKALGRAWVNVVTSESTGDGSNYYDNRVQVEGLSFDAAEKTVILEKNGERIVCGTLYNRRFVLDGGNSIRKSGRCTFSTKKLKVIRDNGFETYKVPMLQVYLNVE